MTVLFVDDEKQILRGIERMLDEADVEWDAEFANSPYEALDILAEDEDIDTVVTDMKMPGMDGAQLLQVVSEKYPHVIRIVLSGETGMDNAIRAIQPMHKYLSKPCNAATLKATIESCVTLKRLMNSDELRRVVGGISKLPSVPIVYQKIMKEIRNERSSVAEIGKIISQDAAMTAKVLQISNSGLFGLRNKVKSASQAATLLGLETIKSLMLTVGVFQESTPPRFRIFLSIT